MHPLISRKKTRHQKQCRLKFTAVCKQVQLAVEGVYFPRSAVGHVGVWYNNCSTCSLCHSPSKRSTRCMCVKKRARGLTVSHGSAPCCSMCAAMIGKKSSKVPVSDSQPQPCPRSCVHAQVLIQLHLHITTWRVHAYKFHHYVYCVQESMSFGAS